jgi:hypothetical protein
MQGNFDLDFEAGADGDLTISSLGRIGANAGLREGDRILSINGRTFQTRDDAMVYLRRFNRGRVPIDVWRDGRRVTYFLSFGPWVNDPWGRSFRYYDQPYYTYNDDVYFDRRDVVARASLGVNVIAAERGGVVVDSIFRDSPAFLAGIRAGDIIVSVNGRRFGGPTLFVNGIRQMSPGEDIDIVVLRDGQEMTFNTQLADGRAAFAQGLMERGEFDEIASRTDSQSRTTLRPNFDGQSRIQIQQRIDELNEELRSLQDRLGRAGEDAQTQGSPTTGAEQRPDTPITGDQQTPDTGTGQPSRQTPEGDTAELPPPPPGGENPAGPGQQSSTNPSAPPSSPTPNPGG